MRSPFFTLLGREEISLTYRPLCIVWVFYRCRFRLFLFFEESITTPLINPEVVVRTEGPVVLDVSFRALRCWGQEDVYVWSCVTREGVNFHSEI